jgi:hypothetical protein
MVQTASSAGASDVQAPSRGDLLRRLHDRPDDFSATEALQALTAASRRELPNADPAAQAAIVHAGLSGVQRMRQAAIGRKR